MAANLVLDGSDWQIRNFWGQPDNWRSYVGTDCDAHGFIPATVPGEIHLDLEKAGIIGDCRLNENSLDNRWVEQDIWVYRKEFCLSAGDIKKYARIVCEGVDTHALFFINGQEIGEHNNCFRPFAADITGLLKEGRNVLGVRIDAGMLPAYDKSHKYVYSESDFLTNRAWIRKPQYQFSWDWNPHLVNVGLWRSVRIEQSDDIFVTQSSVRSSVASDLKSALVTVRCFVNAKQSCRGRITASLDGKEYTKEVTFDEGTGEYSLDIEVKDPELWYPRPSDKQYLYTLDIAVEADGRPAWEETKRIGLRRVELDRSPHPEKGNYFILRVNNEPFFAKGGNWVPQDIIGARITPEHTRKNVKLAAEANFNTLRVWGGGYYADHDLLSCCDEEGIIIWHDFIFACSQYPGDDWGFVSEVMKEAEYQVRELSEHASLCIWCGNNELEWLCNVPFVMERTHIPDYSIFHQRLRNIIEAEDPSRPYWPSSPYSEYLTDHNSEYTGDQHPWAVSILDPAKATDYWQYRDMQCRFPNEGGILSASTVYAMSKYLPPSEIGLGKRGWIHHENSLSASDAGSSRAFVRKWTGLEPNDMPVEDYIYFSNALQAEGLYEYISNFRSRRFDSSSAIFWMYNDSWNAVHSWTIVDYALDKRLSYYPVRNAFSPIAVFPVIRGDRVMIVAVNDTDRAFEGVAEYGRFEPADRLTSSERPVSVAPNGKTVVDEWTSDGADVYAVLRSGEGDVSQNRLLLRRFDCFVPEKPVIDVKYSDGECTLESPVFVWKVCLDFEAQEGVDDNMFDLLPGVPKKVRCRREPVIRTLSDTYRRLKGLD
ncbi:MAG: hypothetical protein IK083_02255 [Abditibacteriota bacterium]|nr:hypothetical protein [Abditibacteriota bacterium]